MHCGSKLTAPGERSFAQRLSLAAAYRLNVLQDIIARPHANWIHVVFRKARG